MAGRPSRESLIRGSTVYRCLCVCVCVCVIVTEQIKWILKQNRASAKNYPIYQVVWWLCFAGLQTTTHYILLNIHSNNAYVLFVTWVSLSLSLVEKSNFCWDTTIDLIETFRVTPFCINYREHQWPEDIVDEVRFWIMSTVLIISSENFSFLYTNAFLTVNLSKY